MPVHHTCPLYGFTREARHTTVLDPSCPECGGVLATQGLAAPAKPGLGVARLARARSFERVLMLAVITPLVLAAAKVGWGAAGVVGGLGGVVVASLVCFVALAPATRHS